ncbi:MAG: hypothetical protein IJB47_07870 [Oscillospiraceae bacterium]|nr:hypothetical protein [Oscillospiraceae bacterium]
MKSEGVAEGDIFKNISEGNTTIIHYSLFIINYQLSITEGGWPGAGQGADTQKYI